MTELDSLTGVKVIGVPKIWFSPTKPRSKDSILFSWIDKVEITVIKALLAAGQPSGELVPE